jgi:hypothetical protein
MVYRGQVLGNVIVLADGVHLPEGSEVLVEPIHRPPAVSVHGVATRNGVPIFPLRGIEQAPDLELVNNLRDDAP